MTICLVVLRCRVRLVHRSGGRPSTLAAMGRAFS
jgi:hypothetical protein